MRKAGEKGAKKVKAKGARPKAEGKADKTLAFRI
jgi:hypothetical protein